MNDRLKIAVPLAVVSSDFRVAATQFREKLVSTTEIRRALFQAVRRIDPMAGFLVLETCNRTEWIASTENPSWMSELLRAHMISVWEETLPGLPSYPIPKAYLNAEAANHVYRLVVGLESLAAGEAQIAGQFQNAMVLARQEHTLSPLLNRLGCGAGRLAKAGFRMGFRSNHRRGIHGLVQLFLQRQLCGVRPPRRVAVVGMGEIGRKIAQLLQESDELRVVRVNRTVRPEHQGKWHALDDLPSLSGGLDALVVATGSMRPVVTQAQLALASRISALPIIDIGVPRQVDAAVQSDPMVLYRNIDSLLDLPRGEIEPETLQRVAAEVEKETQRFLRFCMERDMVLLLDRIHQGRQEFSTSRIPELMASSLSDLDEKTRAKVERVIKKSIDDYASEIHLALQLALEGFWSHR